MNALTTKALAARLLMTSLAHNTQPSHYPTAGMTYAWHLGLCAAINNTTELRMTASDISVSVIQ